MKRKGHHNIDYDKCVLVEFINEDPSISASLAVGFENWLNEKEDIQKLIKNKSHTTIYWPENFPQLTKKKLMNYFKLENFKVTPVRILDSGGNRNSK